MNKSAQGLTARSSHLDLPLVCFPAAGGKTTLRKEESSRNCISGLNAEKDVVRMKSTSK